MNEFDGDVRVAVYRHFVADCKAPGADEVAAVLNVDPEAIRQTFARLADEHVLVLVSDSLEIRMAMPFSAVPTAYEVIIGEKSWWAN